ncbi:nucleoside triphosphate hydrolase [Mesorhizobium sp. L-8-10]|uniref:nucleoside triphosphate hydrolase n=1 Tax=unclassified Mesorhizobium TaxID=325217 RepID=UPI001926B7FE|nr:MULTISPECIES: nucleoside triphosphate hydrolase [unclassified Mesorhizobium]BCH20941.1 nucleoside triphosphate hydrolase [Mesorhizobium sp. L-8-3]BCH28768.1 nucleoside triphosphate hydrolase [Mesorhizobium sp. L-8-10]
MSEIAHVAATLFRKAAGSKRFIVAIAGPPGAGKSTVSEQLAALLPENTAMVVPMDGFHYDNLVLEQLGLSHRKGAPETFDLSGFEALLKRIRGGEPDIAIPIFDRSAELSRAAAALIGRDRKFILVEGNYLLLDEPPWNGLAPLFDFTIFLDVPREELEQRLLQRWRDHGRSDKDGSDWVASNDMPNVDRVLGSRRAPDLVL